MVKNKQLIDVALSLGPACRPASALKRNGLRTFASPFDWLLNLELYHLTYYLSCGLDTFFENAVEVESNNAGKRAVKDVNSGIISLHHFTREADMESQLPEFRQVMRRRFDVVAESIRKSNSILFVTNRSFNYDEVVYFMNVMKMVFGDRKYTYLNIQNSSNLAYNRMQLGNLTILDYRFNDTGASSGESWKGNIKMWDSVLSKFALKSGAGSA